MEEFRLFSANRVPIPILEGFPDDCAKEFGLPGTLKCHAYIGKYPMLFQAIRCGNYELVFSDYLIRSIQKFSANADGFCLELHFILKGNAVIRPKKLKWMGLMEGHHNMIALSRVKNEAYFRSLPASTFDIHFETATIVHLAEKYPQLQPLLDALRDRTSSALFLPLAETTPEMLHLIVQVREAIKSGKVNDPATIAMIEALVILVLDNKSLVTRYNYHYAEIEKLHKAHWLISEHIEEKDIISRTVKEAKLKPDKFRKGFQLLYGYLPSEYLKEQRLQKAREIAMRGMLNTLEEVALVCGFDSARNLSRAYYQRYHEQLASFFDPASKK